MNNFTKSWITSTLAPESIANVKASALGYLDVIRNESSTKYVYVLSNDNEALSVAVDYKDILKENRMPFTDAVLKCAELLGIGGFSFKPVK